MARVQKDIVSYFPHDASASSGDTLTVLQSRFGNDGYAFWFKLLEKLASTEGHCLDCNNPIKWQIFISKMGVDEITTVEMLNLLVEMQAIDKELWELKLIWCQNLVNNLTEVYKNRRRELPQKPVTTERNPITTERNPITTVVSTQSKVKKSRVEKVNKNSNNKQKFGESLNVLLTLDEYEKLKTKFTSTGADQWIEILSSGKAAKPNKYKYDSDYHAILNWARRDQEEGRNNGAHQQRSTTKLPTHYTKPGPDPRLDSITEEPD